MFNSKIKKTALAGGQTTDLESVLLRGSWGTALCAQYLAWADDSGMTENSAHAAANLTLCVELE